MTMTPVKSSNIKALDSSDANGLLVEFHSGEVWEYIDAGHHKQVMVDLDRKGESVGKYFDANVKKVYPSKSVSRPKAAKPEAANANVEFKPGDVVTLKSGSPLLTVAAPFQHQAGTNLIDVEWFSGGEVKRDSFHPDCLVKNGDGSLLPISELELCTRKDAVIFRGSGGVG